MHNLISFLSRFYLFILFLFLQFICLSIIFSNKGISYQQNAIFSIANNSIAAINKRTSSVREFFSLREQNEILQEQNRMLLEGKKSAFRKIEGDFVILEDTIWKRQYRLLSAKVINGTLYQDKNYFTINKGSEDGVSQKKGVICDAGIVGRVVAVSDHYSVIETVISETFSTGAYVKRTGNLGYLKWDKDPGFTKMTEVVATAPIAIGDLVYSKEGSGYFPPDTKIGEISDLIEKKGEAYYDIKIKLSTNFSKLTKVYVVTNEFQEELEALQGDYYP